MNKCICPPDAHDDGCAVCIPQVSPYQDIHICSVWEVWKFYNMYPEANFISIRDRTPSKPVLEQYNLFDSKRLQNSLVLEMDDIVYPNPHLTNVTIPNEEHISKLINWANVKTSENFEPFVIHCTAGVSRSSACALIVQALIAPEYLLTIIDPRLHYPNQRILEIASKLLNMPDLVPTVKKFYALNDFPFSF